MAKRIAVLVSGGGTNLQALIDAQQRGELGGGEIAAVISSKKGAFALERAAKAGISGYVLSRKKFESNQAMTVALVDTPHFSALTPSSKVEISAIRIMSGYFSLI